jgi:drug/metabolite transporter (DMT)-like permease
LADLALTLIMAIWGSSFAILRSLLGDAAASPLALVAVRMAIASALLFGFMLATPAGRAQLRGLRGGLLRDGLIAAGLLGIGFLLQTEGLQRTTASGADSSPHAGGLDALIELALFRKRPAKPALIGVLLAFVGITVLSAPGAWPRGHRAGRRAHPGVCGGVCRTDRRAGSDRAEVPGDPAAALQLATTGPWRRSPDPGGSAAFLRHPGSGWPLLYLALFATLLAFGVQTWAQKILPPVRVALISSLEPVFAALWAALLIGAAGPARAAGRRPIVLGSRSARPARAARAGPSSG